MASDWARYLELVERELRATLATPHERLAPFYGMMRYHLGYADESLAEMAHGAGKLVRPLLCLLSCAAAGGNPESALPAAVAVELVHNFSLVHDDIEDASLTRRHRPTVWSLWGTSHGINTGDALFSLARLTLARLADRGVPALRVARAYAALDTACVALCEGQYLDLAFENEPTVGLDDYLWMIRGKTAALMACACELGALAAAEDTETIAALHRFGYNLGMAFQVEDDRIGVWGDQARTGKPVGDDIRNRKKVLPVVWVWEEVKSGQPTRPQVQAAGALEGLYHTEPPNLSSVPEVVRVLEEAGARGYCDKLADEYTALAIESLSQAAADPSAVAALRELAASLVGRTR